MPKYFILSPSALDSAIKARGETPQEAVKNIDAGTDIPTRSVIIAEGDVHRFVVVEPGESSTPVITRTRNPKPPEQIIASPYVNGDMVVTWVHVDAADSYVVYVDGAAVDEVTDARTQQPAPPAGECAQIQVASKILDFEGTKSAAVEYEAPTPEA